MSGFVSCWDSYGAVTHKNVNARSLTSISSSTFRASCSDITKNVVKLQGLYADDTISEHDESVMKVRRSAVPGCARTLEPA